MKRVIVMVYSSTNQHPQPSPSSSVQAQPSLPKKGLKIAGFVCPVMMGITCFEMSMCHVLVLLECVAVLLCFPQRLIRC